MPEIQSENESFRNSAMGRIIPIIGFGLALVVLVFANYLGKTRLIDARLDFDRRNLQQFFVAGSYDNDLVLDTYYLHAEPGRSNLINVDLLGLRRDRLAYIARNAGQVVAIMVPATAEDGFNGYVDLLVAVDMFGHISAARVISTNDSDELHGVIDVIESQWMKEFDGNGMRDIRRISWETISPENEYDQFVGASVTPKTVSDRIYNTLVFVQSNRIALMEGDGR